MGTIIRKIYYSGTFRSVVTPTVGFGVAGALWGVDIYRGAIESNEAFINPFSFISGAFLFGIIGSLSLVIFSGDVKKILKVVVIGTIGWLLAFLLPLSIGYYLFLAGGIIGFINLLFLFLTDIDLFSFLVFPLSVLVWERWIEFLLTGIMVGLFYGILLKKPLARSPLLIGVGFTISSLVSPAVGNLLGGVINSFFAVFLVTFLLIGITLGSVIGLSFREKFTHAL